MSLGTLLCSFIIFHASFPEATEILSFLLIQIKNEHFYTARSSKCKPAKNILYRYISKKYTDTKLCTKTNSSSTKNVSVEKHINHVSSPATMLSHKHKGPS